MHSRSGLDSWFQWCDDNLADPFAGVDLKDDCTGLSLDIPHLCFDPDTNVNMNMYAFKDTSRDEHTQKREYAIIQYYLYICT